MISFKDEEKILKRFLKRDRDLSFSQIVKYMIVGFSAFALTACGGGGGGGGSSSSGGVLPEKAEGIIISNGKEYTNNDSFKLTGEAKNGIYSNGNIINRGTIKVHDTDSGTKIVSLSDTSETAGKILELLKVNGESVAILVDGGKSENTIKVTNENSGKLLISGNSVHGIFGVFADITNEGTIKTDGETEDVTGISSAGGDVTNKGDIILVGKDSVGIRAHNHIKIGDIDINSGNEERIEVINNGTIDVTGESTEGISADGSYINVTNNSEINVTNKLVEGKKSGVFTVGINSDGGAKGEEDRWENNTITNNGTINVKFTSNSKVAEGNEDTYGVYGIAVNGDKMVIDNSKNINITAEIGKEHEGANIAGIRTTGTDNKSTNDGNITINIKSDEVYDNVSASGMLINTAEDENVHNGEESEAVNNGNIKITGNAKSYGIRIEAEGAKGVNNKEIIVENGFVSFPDETPLEEILEKTSSGMYVSNGEIINEAGGTITVSGSTVGMMSTGGKAVNNGTIEISGKTGNADKVMTSMGMVANGASATSVINKGEITSSVGDINGMLAYNGGIVTNEKDIILKGNSSEGMTAENNSKASNSGTITIGNEKSYGMRAKSGSTVTNEKNGTIEVNGKDSFGIYSSDRGEANNSGTITIGAKSTGIMIAENGTGANHGTIEVNGVNVNEKDIAVVVPVPDTEDKEVDVNGTIEKAKEELSFGIMVSDGKTKENTLTVNEARGTINVSNSSIGIYSEGSTVENKGTIKIEGIIKEEDVSNDEDYFYTVGIFVNETTGINSGAINGEGYRITGMNALTPNSYIRNEKTGNININGLEAYGMRAESGATAENYGTIIINGEDAKGIEVEGSSIARNYGTITVTGGKDVEKENSANGMRAEKGGKIYNEEGAVINVKEGATGMVASGEGSYAENNGIINVYVGAIGGMSAWDGGTIRNNGTINIQKGADAWGAHADEKSTNEEGTGEVKHDVEIKENSTYITGTNKDGSYGKISASTVAMDGQHIISADIAEGSYEDSYSLDDVIKAEEIELGENYKTASTSLLYSAVTTIDEEGNMDAEVKRNDKKLSDFTKSNFSQVSNVFDKNMSKEKYSLLSAEQKKLVDAVFSKTSSEKELNQAIAEISGNEYMNISKQIFDIKDSFKKYDSSVISDLAVYDFNFTFIGEYSDVDSKGGIAGYESKMTGFNGAVKFTDTLYGVLGYGYSDIDYDGSSDGKIQTIHTGIYKDFVYNKTDIRFGLLGEYNFHETDRSVLEDKAKSDFNSYVVGATADVSRKFGESLYIKPMFSLDISYGNVEDFKEEHSINDLKINEENYTSVVSALGFKAGKEFENSELFMSAKYSYEFGDMDKDMSITLLNEKVNVKNNDMEEGQFDISIGGEYSLNSLILSAEAGKEFGRREREYIKAGFSYSF